MKMTARYPSVSAVVAFTVTGFKCVCLTSWLPFLCNYAKTLTYCNTYYFY